MSEPLDPQRWLEGGDAPAGFESAARAQELPEPDPAQLARTLEGVARQLGRPELVQAFHAQVAPALTVQAAAAGARTLVRFKLGVGLVAALVIGWLAWAALERSTPPVPPMPAPAQAAPAQPSPVHAEPAAASTPVAEPTEPKTEKPRTVPPVPPVAATARATRVPRAAARSKAPPRAAAPDPQGELVLLEAAQRALTGAPQQALALTEQHRRRFAQPQFEQEREMLAIEALLRLGRSEPGRARAAAFERRFARSSHLPRLRSLLDPVRSAP